MGRLFIDITELESWEGKLTGVPRVMDELSSRFSTDDKITFVTWLPAGYQLTKYYSSEEKTNNVSNVKTRFSYFDTTIAKKIYSRSVIVRKTWHFLKSIKRNKTSALRFQPQLIKGDVLLILADWHGGDPAFRDAIDKMHSRGVKIAQIVYDLIPIMTPQYSGHSTEMLSTYSKEIYPLCDVIFSISEHTKKDIDKWLVSNGLHAPRIVVIRLGDDFASVKPRKNLDKEFLDRMPSGKFVLSVGTVEARKNHTLLYYVYKLARMRNVELPPLVIVGRLGWLSADIYQIMTHDPEVSSNFIFMQNVSDEELDWLYQNCLYSVYASFYEGWGLPIAESVARGVVCIASSTSSMQEIAGDLLEYFNPGSTDECLALFEKYMDPKELKLAQQKLKNYKLSSWDDTYNVVKRYTGV